MKDIAINGEKLKNEINCLGNKVDMCVWNNPIWINKITSCCVEMMEFRVNGAVNEDFNWDVFFLWLSGRGGLCMEGRCVAEDNQLKAP